MNNNSKKNDPLSVAVAARDRDVLKYVCDGLDRDQAMLAFQPIVSADGTNAPSFYEGLIRIMDRTGRIIPAKEFIHVVENGELGRKIDCIALKLGLQALRKHPDLRLSINMSPLSIDYKPWMKTLNKGLRDAPTVGERLILEITERSALDMPGKVQAFMGKLQNRGIAFALDDFGAGFTSFRYLKDFYFDILKIDGEFIRGIQNDPDNQALTKSMIDIAKHFEMLTVAEMVESEQEAKFLETLGIDCMQGYYFGVPTIRPYWALDPELRSKAG
jgi:EAL domain-containing protein (putative c-di-GMP-specific phosphodiesterase class I)